MNVADALRARTSTRAFLDRSIPQDTLQALFRDAQQAPSNCNTQPWQTYVISGAKKDALKAELQQLVASGADPEPDFNWQVRYRDEHRTRQVDAAFALYSALGIERDDRAARGQAMLRNWAFFDAPHAVFFTMEKYLDIMGAVDLGIYAQSLALLLTERGYGSCMQGALGMYPGPLRRLLGLPESRGVLFGMSIGFPDHAAEANRARPGRVDPDTSVTFIG